MSESFEFAFADLIRYEGGYANVEGDPGGETRWGISKQAYPDLDILNLRLDEAKEIYYRDFWKPLRLDEIKSALVATEIFEQNVNMRAGRAVRHLQASLLYQGFALKVDGVLGPVTIQAVNAADSDVLLRFLNGLQLMHYFGMDAVDVALKARGSWRGKFIKGWLRRVKII